MADGIARHDAGARAPCQHGEDKSNGTLPQNGYRIVRSKLPLFNTLETCVHWFDPGRLIERYTLRDYFHATLDNPVHNANVLGEAAACRFEAGCNANFLVDGTLCVKSPVAIEATSAGDMMKSNDTISRHIPGDAVADFHHHTGCFVTINARRRQ